MPYSADPLSLTTAIGRVVAISTPTEHSPVKLDWGRWVSNMALQFTKFSSPPLRRIFLLNNDSVQQEQLPGSGVEYARQNIQTVEILSLLGGSSENSLILAFGSWKYSLSSWVESLKAIAHSNFASQIGKFYDSQLQIWRKLESEYSDDSLFVLSDGGSRFSNAGEVCRTWLRRIIRSRISQESQSGAWACCLLTVLPEGTSSNEKLRLHRMIALDPTSWCGDPNWQSSLPTSLLARVFACTEFWISIPSSVLVQEVFSKLSEGIDNAENVKVIAPSVVLGWHPVRDFILFLGSPSKTRVFVFMDLHERLQVILAEPAGD